MTTGPELIQCCANADADAVRSYEGGGGGIAPPASEKRYLYQSDQIILVEEFLLVPSGDTKAWAFQVLFVKSGDRLSNATMTSQETETSLTAN
jgi:hypothetical protein